MHFKTCCSFFSHLQRIFRRIEPVEFLLRRPGKNLGGRFMAHTSPILPANLKIGLMSFQSHLMDSSHLGVIGKIDGQKIRRKIKTHDVVNRKSKLRV